jgi:NADH-quinone oxidoreductase subunit G
MKTETVNLRIDGTPVEVAAGTTILEAAREADVEIPTLCYHPSLEASAACGICVVKLEGRGGMTRACAAEAEEGMEVITHDPEIVRVRRTVLELILSNHPNECLTCGRNGTCELQALAERFGIRSESFPSVVRELPPDSTTGSVVLDPRKCVKCGRCLTVCQDLQDVWALSFLERSLQTRIAPAGEIDLADSPCIRCGQCSAHCPVGAILEYDQTEAVWDALRDPQMHCVAQIAPAVRVSVGESFGYAPGANLSGQIYQALRRMGFDAVFDTNFGADVTIVEEASEFAHRLKDAPDELPLITTCCPSWVDFMEKFHSDMIKHFSSCKSPHAILGTLTKTYYAEQIGVPREKIFMVSFMPCTSKKYEIGRTDEMYASGEQDVDVSITTRELVRMVQQSGIAFRDLSCLEQPDSPLGDYSGAGVIFGATGGVMEAALRSAHYYVTGEEAPDLEFAPLHSLDGVKEMETTVGGKTIRVAVAHGLGNVETVIDRVRDAAAAGTDPPYHFIEVMACPGGCIGGGGQSWFVNNDILRQRAEGLRKDDRLREIRMSHRNPAVQTIYEGFLGEPGGERAHELLHTRYTPRPQYRR